MDISNNDGKEICGSSKKAKTWDDSRDFISELPDTILVHILSFLPIKDAINTVLRRFGDLWRSVQVLDFDSCFYHDCEHHFRHPHDHNESFVDLIRHVVDLHDSSRLDKLCLNFGFSLYYCKDKLFQYGNVVKLEWEKGTADQIERLIRYAISREVKVLDLNLKSCEALFPIELYDLPDVLSRYYLTHLKLTAFDITSCTTVDLKSLKVLLLHDVSLNDDIMEKVLVGCPFLEDLTLIDCYGLQKPVCEESDAFS